MPYDLSVVSKSQSKEPLRIVLYTVEGFGKTTFGSQAPNPIFIPTEKGAGDLTVNTLPLCRSWEDLCDGLKSIGTTEHNFQTVVIDTVTGIERLIWDRISRENGKTHIEEIGWAKGYKLALKLWGELFKQLDYVNDRGLWIILLCHCETDEANPAEEHLQKYDYYRMRLREDAANQVYEWADIVLFGNYKTYATTMADGTAKAIGGVERTLYTERRPSHWAKNRYRLPYEIPISAPPGTEPKNWEIFFTTLTNCRNLKGATEGHGTN